ncbi:hypothetical protein ABZX85_12470 [Streptomyces sp. NPDC004539]|uniref:hypothetical protein n=1 Tax=Streptomyces sp. NPDC004539 TaxID=3154280 RepID=UPI00339F0A52
MTTLLRQAALLVTLLGLLSAACAAVSLRRVQPTVALLTDFLLAAGLIRLAAQPSWTSLAVAAVTIAVRLVVNAGLRVLDARRGVGAAPG